jgi:hypothetical protein
VLELVSAGLVGQKSHYDRSFFSTGGLLGKNPQYGRSFSDILISIGFCYFVLILVCLVSRWAYRQYK